MIAAHDAARSRKVGDTEMEEGREVRSLVARSKTKVGVVKPGVRVPRHDVEARAVSRGLVQATTAPQESIAMPGAANSGSENTSPTVEKALMLKSPPMKSTECMNMCSWNRCKRGRCVTLLGDFVLKMN